jgi:hypothetical protein
LLSLLLLFVSILREVHFVGWIANKSLHLSL